MPSATARLRHLPATLALCAALLLSSAYAPTPASADAASHAMQTQLDAVLAKIAGPGKGFVVVSESTNRDRTSVARLRFGRTGVSSAGSSSRTAWRGATSGSAGARSVRWDTSQTVRRTVIAPGAVRHLDIALVLDRSIPKGTARRIATALATAGGLRRAR